MSFVSSPVQLAAAQARLTRVPWVKLAGATGQFLLLVLLFQAYAIQTEPFRHLMLAMAIAFPIHHLLPLQYRMPFFTVLSVGSVFLVLDAVSAAWILGLGLAMLGLCHLPAPFKVRVGLVVLFTLGLAVVRLGWVTSPWPGSVLPLLGALFMFRMIVYLYDLRHEKSPANAWRSVTYFFMAPNICFTLLPIVDYKTYCKNYYDKDPFEIYEVGLEWIFRGAIHLLLYRLVYQYAMISPTEVASSGDFLRFIVTTYLLYLNISGIFHIIVGLLHMFGFRLPETHHRYLLASSFTDFWRRINIYWKDFIMKVFFYPAFVRFKKLGPTRSLIAATMTAFFFTWLLHSYQWFWLRGSILLTPQDVLFWLILALLVLANSLSEARSKKKPAPSKLAANLALAFRTIGTFLSITLLWSLWTAESMSEWFGLVAQVRYISANDALIIVGILGAIGVLAVLLERPKKRAPLKAKTVDALRYWRTGGIRFASSALIVGLAVTQVQNLLPADARTFVRSVERPRLNQADMAQLQRGYYEDLVQVGRFSPELAELYGERPADYFRDWGDFLNDPTSDYLSHVMRPNASYTYLEKNYTTNEWGLRDKTYTKAKPAGVYRIALVGASNSLGWGVDDAECFETIAEEKLNAARTGGHAWEILNFSVNSYDPVRKLMMLEQRVFEFEPDAVYFEANTGDENFLVRNITMALERDVDLPYEIIGRIVQETGIDGTTDSLEAERRLRPYRVELTRWVYEQVVRVCRERGVRSCWVYVPHSAQAFDDVADETQIAREAGFDEIIDLSPAFMGVPAEALKVKPWDFHPNAYGHERIADELVKHVEANLPSSLSP